MCVTCYICRYDSGDFDSGEEVAKKVNGDGGFMDHDLDGFWIIRCPSMHQGDCIHMD